MRYLCCAVIYTNAIWSHTFVRLTSTVRWFWACKQTKRDPQLSYQPESQWHHETQWDVSPMLPFLICKCAEVINRTQRASAQFPWRTSAFACVFAQNRWACGTIMSEIISRKYPNSHPHPSFRDRWEASAFIIAMKVFIFGDNTCPESFLVPLFSSYEKLNCASCFFIVPFFCTQGGTQQSRILINYSRYRFFSVRDLHFLFFFLYLVCVNSVQDKLSELSFL